MGCASSKQSRCQHCRTAYSPMTRRSFSMNVHHPPQKKGDSYHMVALTSSTLGSLVHDPSQIDLNFAAKKGEDDFDREVFDDAKKNHELGGIEQNQEFAMGMIEAKAWSKMIDEKITKVAPKTPIRTPPGEPETIYVRELMEGLEDNTSPLRGSGEHHYRSFSFHVLADSIPSLVDSPRTRDFQENIVESNNKKNKAWFDASEEKEDDVFGRNGNLISKAIVSEFDPEVISAFRKALEELSPTNPFHLKPREDVQVIKDSNNGVDCNDKIVNHDEEKKMSNGFVGDNDYAHVNGFVERMIAEDKDDVYVQSNDEEDEEEEEEEVKKERVILYFTSLRGVRRTYENCCYVRLILKGLGVRVDERDVSMHSGFKEELKELLGDRFNGGLPKVFIGERYIGGTEDIRKLHEDGKLEKVVEHCQRLDDDGGNLVDVCEACGDIRFIPCETCSGSCKIYYEFDEEEDEDNEHANEDEDEYGFQRCPDCNENGLIRCPICCY